MSEASEVPSQAIKLTQLEVKHRTPSGVGVEAVLGWDQTQAGYGQDEDGLAQAGPTDRWIDEIIGDLIFIFVL